MVIVVTNSGGARGGMKVKVFYVPVVGKSFFETPGCIMSEKSLFSIHWVFQFVSIGGPINKYMWVKFLIRLTNTAQVLVSYIFSNWLFKYYFKPPFWVWWNLCVVVSCTWKSQLIIQLLVFKRRVVAVAFPSFKRHRDSYTCMWI